MMLLTIFLLLMPGPRAEAQLRTQAALPSLQNSPLPRLAPLSFTAPGIGTPLTGLSAAGLVSPIASLSAVAAPTPIAGPAARTAVSPALAAAFTPMLKARVGDLGGSAVQSGLRQAYDGGKITAERSTPRAFKDGGPLAAVAAEVPSASLRPSLSRPALSGSSDRKGLPTPAAEAPAVPAWKKALRVLGDVASVLGSAYGGWKLADIGYSLLIHHNALAAALPLLAVLGGAAFWLRRRAAQGKGGAAYPTLLGTFAANTVGQLLWTLTGSLAGFGVGLALGILAGLYAGGVLPRLPRKG